MHLCAERRTALTAELKGSMGASFANTAVMKKLDAATVARFKATAEQEASAGRRSLGTHAGTPGKYGGQEAARDAARRVLRARRAAR